MIASPEDKEKRRKSLERKKKDRTRRNPMAVEVRTPKYRLRIIEDSKNEKKGANSWHSYIDKDDLND